jgi:dTDP-4-dehydrorhamnose reductase
MADPDACEKDPEAATLTNVVGARSVARACVAAGARLIAISTDLVFGGDATNFAENDQASPVSVYGRTKLAAEHAAIDIDPRAIILRTALIHGRGFGPKASASESVARRLSRGEPATLFDDEWRTPIDAGSVADAVTRLLERPQLSGVFHLGGLERLTRFELGERVAMALGGDAGLLRRAQRAAHNGAPRPRDVSLGISKARELLGWEPGPLIETIREGRNA